MLLFTILLVGFHYKKEEVTKGVKLNSKATSLLIRFQILALGLVYEFCGIVIVKSILGPGNSLISRNRTNNNGVKEQDKLSLDID